MRHARAVLMACCAVATLAMLAPGAHADEYTKETHLTFSGPVQIPGMTLPAGTYTFKLADPESGRRTIQVWDKDGGKLLATLMTIPDQMLEPASDPVVLFREQPAGAPQAIKAWFYPGDRYGQEFVYPRNQAMRIAAANNESVMAYTKETREDMDAAAMRQADVGRVDAQGQVAESDRADTTTAASGAATATTTSDTAAAAPRPVDDDAPVASTAQADTAADPSANRSQAGAVGTTGTVERTAPSAPARSGSAAAPAQAQSGSTAARSQDTDTTARAEQLPRTASPVGLLGMLSALSLAGAIGLTARRRYAESRR